MNTVFRVDSSIQIGAGHVMRCLTLAKELKKKSTVQFICRNRKGNLINKIESEGFKVFMLSEAAAKDDMDELSGIDWLGNSQENDAFECINILKKIKSTSGPILIFIKNKQSIYKGKRVTWKPTEIRKRFIKSLIK